MPIIENDDLSFLPLLLDQDLYLVKEQLVEVSTTVSAHSATSTIEQDVAKPKVNISEGEVAPVSGLRYYGAPKKGIVVFVDIDVPDLLRTDEYQLLLRIMGSVKLTPNEFALVNLSENKGSSSDEIIKELAPQTIIFMGAGDKSYTSLPLYTPTPMNGLVYLRTTTLANLLSDTTNQHKKPLWEALKLILL